MTGVDPEVVGGWVRPVLDERFQVRERAIASSRRVIRASANAIRHLHRDEVDAAEELIEEAGRMLAETSEELAGHPDVLYAGYVSDAAKEYAEARLTLAIFTGGSILPPEALGVDPIPYLHGLGEAVGECRRRLLDGLRDGRLEQADALLETMDAVVDLLASLDYPDGMTSGLRRTTDLARGLAERSRADLTTTAVQERLRAELSRRLDGADG